MDLLEKTDIGRAAERIRAHIRHTPCLVIEAGVLCPARLVLKLEQTQITSSFKVRGAFNTLLQVPAPDAGVIAASGGNHGIAVAHAANALGLRAEIFVPVIASPIKVRRLQELGAQVVQTGERYADSLTAMQERQAQTGAIDIHAYNQPTVLAGQGTLTREFERQARALGYMLHGMVIAVGGGGLIGGAMAWLRDTMQLVAVEPTSAPTLNQALAAGEAVDVEVSGIAADSLGARRIGELCLSLARSFPPKSVLVDDQAIKDAQAWLYEQCRIVSEPGGAAALAALMTGAWPSQADQTIGVVVCGGNADLSQFA